MRTSLLVRDNKKSSLLKFLLSIAMERGRGSGAACESGGRAMHSLTCLLLSMVVRDLTCPCIAACCGSDVNLAPDTIDLIGTVEKRGLSPKLRPDMSEVEVAALAGLKT